MTTSSITRPLPDDPVLLLHAYLDGELDPINALELERRIAADPVLAAERERIETLRRLMRERYPRESPSPELRPRIETAIGIPSARQRPSWRALAASIVAAAVIASSLTWLLVGQRRTDATEVIVVAAHIRGLMAPQPTDVTSSESHTVKPWFNGRIPQAPRVIDLANAGFPLAGGRIDVIGRNPSPTLVYRRRQHVISLTAIPATGLADLVPSRDNIDGYNVVKWVENGVAYWAVSDLNAAELDEFAKLFRAAG